jgi:phosphonate transport system substrate-binding protein
MAQVVPLVMRDIDREFHSVFIASTESDVTDVAGLAGKRFAFGSKSSTSGHLMPRHFLLSEFQIDPDKDFAGAPVYRMKAGARRRQTCTRCLFMP